ncbi:MAG TPA: hypothetical protein VGJ73_14230 [Verrucomicrobiae bacterium]|jgi:hypothetical protein
MDALIQASALIAGNNGNAANQIRAVARLREQRRSYATHIPRAALADSLALGYKYIAPLGL